MKKEETGHEVLSFLTLEEDDTRSIETIDLIKSKSPTPQSDTGDPTVRTTALKKLRQLQIGRKIKESDNKEAVDKAIQLFEKIFSAASLVHVKKSATPSTRVQDSTIQSANANTPNLFDPELKMALALVQQRIGRNKKNEATLDTKHGLANLFDALERHKRDANLPGSEVRQMLEREGYTTSVGTSWGDLAHQYFLSELCKQTGEPNINLRSERRRGQPLSMLKDAYGTSILRLVNCVSK